MIAFFVLAGLMMAAALWFVVRPLISGQRFASGVTHGSTNLSIYRDQLQELSRDLENGVLDRSQYDSAREEIERRVLDEVEQDAADQAAGESPKWTLAVTLALAVPLVSVPLYLWLGSPATLDAKKMEALAASRDEGHAITPERIEQMVGQLKARLESNPDDVEGWRMLAKTASAIGQYEDAVLAYRQAIQRFPNDAQLLADFADTLAMAQGRSLSGEPEVAIARALQLDPANVKALALGGTIAYEKQRYQEAANLWRRILDVVPPESEFAQRILSSIADAEAKISRPNQQISGLADTQSKAVARKVTGTVRVADEILSKAPKTAVVFVFARAATGPAMPLAVQRATLADLPLRFELTDAMAMAPGMSISQFPDLLIGARVSISGTATPQPGDFESALVPVKGVAPKADLVIDRAR